MEDSFVALILLIVVIVLGFSFLYFFDEESLKKIKKISKRIFLITRTLFSVEWIRRTYLALQFLGIGFLIYFNATKGRSWSPIPSYSKRWGFEWNFLDDHYWTDEKHNWVLLICIIGPFIFAKTLDWIYSSKEGTKEND